MTTESIEVRLARLEGSYEQINERLGTIEGRLDNLETGLVSLRTEMYQGFENLGDKLRQEMRTQFYWLLGLIFLGVMIPLALNAIF